jgi:ADP-ribosyl-[dinitrogen reductase] hydrolase
LQERPSLTILEAGNLIGSSGHVAESVPLAIFAAQQIRKTNAKEIIAGIVSCGGDTDTNASMAGQIMGTFLGYSKLPADILSYFDRIRESGYILDISKKLCHIPISTK